MNQQDVFDRVVAHAREQGRRSMLPTGSCAYRGEDGTKCFIGALITDEAYHRGLECQGASSHEVHEALAASGVVVETTEDVNLCSRLQTIHDETGVAGWDIRNHWETEFQNVAQQFGLTYTPPKKTA